MGMIGRLAVVLLAVAGALPAMSAGEITVTGKGTVKRQPDKMKIMFSVSATNPDMTKAREAFEELSAKASAALAAAGAVTNEVITAGGYMEKTYSWESGKRMFEGYRFAENYTFTAAMDRARLLKVKQELFRSEAIESLEESFELFDPEALRGEARAAAVANARAIAEGLAEAAGVELGEILLIEYGERGSSSIAYRNLAMAKGMDEAEFGAEPMEAQLRDLAVSDSVVVRWRLK